VQFLIHLAGTAVFTAENRITCALPGVDLAGNSIMLGEAGTVPLRCQKILGVLVLWRELS